MATLSREAERTARFCISTRLWIWPEKKLRQVERIKKFKKTFIRMFFFSTYQYSFRYWKDNRIGLIDWRSFWRNSDALGRQGHAIINWHDEKLHSRWREWHGFQSRNAGPRRRGLGTCGSSDFTSVCHRGSRQIIADVGQFKSYRGMEQRHRGMQRLSNSTLCSR